MSDNFTDTIKQVSKPATEENKTGNIKSKNNNGTTTTDPLENSMNIKTADILKSHSPNVSRNSFERVKSANGKATASSHTSVTNQQSTSFQLPLASTIHSLSNVQPQRHPRPIAIAQKIPVTQAVNIASNSTPTSTSTSISTSTNLESASSRKRGKSIDSTTNSKPVKKKQTKLKAETPTTAQILPSTIQSLHQRQQNDLMQEDDNNKNYQQAGHRPVTSCTHCRQHKIKCNAQERFPASCQRCEKMNLNCEIDPQFRPRKGSQIQSLRNDVDELKLKIEYLQRHESLISQALSQQQKPTTATMTTTAAPVGEVTGAAHAVSNPATSGQKGRSPLSSARSTTSSTTSFGHNSPRQLDSIDENSPSSHHSGTTILQREPQLLSDHRTTSLSPQLLNDSVPANSDGKNLPPVLELSVRSASVSTFDNTEHPSSTIRATAAATTTATAAKDLPSATTNVISGPSLTAELHPSSTVYEEFILGEVQISLAKANALHKVFMEQYSTSFPIISSSSASELYTQSQLLFWTVCLTACSSDPEPTLYNNLASLIKQLAIETCWIRTPRSTHICQALLILCIWPLPNQKVLDDCSYRFVGLAKSLGYQLGLHRGKFMTEFSRTQVALPDAEKWRTRTWLGIFFAEQFWASQLGLPPSSGTDYLVENARIDKNLPKNFRSLISLAIFQAKLVNVMGSSVVSPDGLMEARNRAGSLAILERELERLIFKLEIGDDIAIEIYYLYVRLTICCFAFLPETPTEDQTKYVTIAYLTATKVVTLVSKLLETRNLIELPIYIRQSVTYAALILFKLHLTPLLLDKYIDSARQSIVTVHRLFRNQLSAWKNVQNDISRTAQVLEKLNYVLFTYPELYTKNEGIITRMRSHLTGSLFYDLVWCVHEARRRTIEEQKSGKSKPRDNSKDRPVPLPFFNQINKDDFQTITTTTPGGTTITKLVPTENAMNLATQNATANGLSKPTEIKGIPFSMLESTGSVAVNSFNMEFNRASTTVPSAVDSVSMGIPTKLSSTSSTIVAGSSDSRSSSTGMEDAVMDTYGGNQSAKPLEMAASLFSSHHTQGRSTIDSIMPTLQQQADAGSLRRSREAVKNKKISSKQNSDYGSGGSQQNQQKLSHLVPKSQEPKFNYNGPQTPQQQIQQHQKHQQQLHLQQQLQQQLYQQQQSPFDFNQSTQLGSTSFDVGRSLKLKQHQSSISQPTTGAAAVAATGAADDDFDSFFQQQQVQWHGGDQNNMNGNDDDFLGWFDMNMAPEF